MAAQRTKGDFFNAKGNLNFVWDLNGNEYFTTREGKKKMLTIPPRRKDYLADL